MTARIQKIYDYTLKRKGEVAYQIVDDNGVPVKNSGLWRTKKACMAQLVKLGYKYGGIETVHQNYSHWAAFEFAK